MILTGFLAGCGGGSDASGQSSATGGSPGVTALSANIVVTADSNQVSSKGSFRPATAYLSRSSRVMKSAGDGQSAVTFSTSIVTPGYYQVYVWWPQTAPGAGQVDVRVHHGGGTTVTTVDQSILGGQWNSVGTYLMNTGSAAVDVADRQGTVAYADAVRFAYVGDSAPVLGIGATELPLANDGAPYTASLDVNGGVAPYTLSVSKGTLPAGISLDSATGVISGRPVYLGSFPFSVSVRDASGESATTDFTITVLQATTAVAPSALAPVIAHALRLDGRPSGAAPALSGLLSVITSMPEGEWSMVNLNHFSDVWTPDDLRPLYGWSNPPPSKIIEAWSSFAWDPNRGDLILFGGGHANYPGNDVYRWHGTTRLWERASLPSQITQDDLGNWMAIDGPDAAPIAAHTYDNNLFLPLIDRFIVLGGGAFNSGGAYLREVTPTTQRHTGPYLFDPSLANPNEVGGTTGSHVQRVAPHPEIIGGNMWQNRDIWKNIPGNPALPGGYVNSCTAYSAEGGRDVVYEAAIDAGGGTSLGLYKYTINSVSDPTQDTIQKVGAFWNGTSAATSCGYDPTDKVLLRIGTNQIPFVYWDMHNPGPGNRDSRMTPVDATGEFPALLSSGALNLANCGMDYDPTRNQFVMWCGDGRVWSIKPPATLSPNGWTITKQPAPLLATPNGDYGTGILGKWKYIDNLDVFMGLQDATQGNIWIYKPVGWKNPSGNLVPPPTVSLTTPANGTSFASGAPITISANAASPTGSISEVDFYSGGNKIGVATSPPYSYTWTHAPAGNFQVLAIAVDSIGQQTISAPINITVQPGPTGTVQLQDGVNGYALTQGTFLDSYNQGYVMGGQTFLRNLGAQYTDLIRFAIFTPEGGPLTPGATIQSATLSLYKYSYYSANYSLNRMLVNWSEAGATWLQANVGQSWNTIGAQGSGTDYGASPDATVTTGFNPGWVTFDVTAAIQSMSSGQANYGWRLVTLAGSDTQNLRYFYTSHYLANPAQRPILTITYSTAP